jgi:Glycosyl transferase family 2
MKLVLTLVVRDEADIVDAQLAYHLNAGVDFVLATDHASTDGTLDVLHRYEREGHLRLFDVAGEMRESEWRTRMARLAATEHGADWIINTDADEFWLPRVGTLKESLGAVPVDVGVVWALTCHFVPRPEDGRSFAERMTARFAPQAALNDPTSPYRPHAKAAHRADPDIVVWFGSHRVTSRMRALPGWHPADVFHFPFRTLAQYERKSSRRARGDRPLGQYVRGLQAREHGRLEDVYGTLVIGDATLARGLTDGSLVEDTRLRDALRGHATDSRVPRNGRFALDEAALRDADLVRVVRRLDGVRQRVEALERRVGP